jgi:hypothetical protein
MNYGFPSLAQLKLLLQEVYCPEDETPVEWMLLTTEVVADVQAASTELLHKYFLI